MVDRRGQERMIEPVWGFAERVAKGINEYHRTDDEVVALAVAALEAHAAVERVRALHHRSSFMPIHLAGYCVECRGMWPCETVIALGESEDS